MLVQQEAAQRIQKDPGYSREAGQNNRHEIKHEMHQHFLSSTGQSRSGNEWYVMKAHIFSEEDLCALFIYSEAVNSHTGDAMQMFRAADSCDLPESPGETGNASVFPWNR